MPVNGPPMLMATTKPITIKPTRCGGAVRGVRWAKA
jgi:hypothetical protein